MESEEEGETLGLVSEGSLFIRQNEIQVKSKTRKKLSMLCSAIVFIHVAIIVSKSKGEKQKSL